VSRLLLLLPLVAVGCGGVDPCAGVAGACLAVHVTSSAVREVDQLDVAVTIGAVHGTAITMRSGATPLPAATAIELGSSIDAPVEIHVAIDAERGGAVIGSGAAATTIAPGEHASVALRIGDVVDGGAPDLAGAACSPGGLYCGGDKLTGDPGTLYRCDAPAAPSVRGVCSAGCILRPGRDDECRGSGGICVVGAFYCGGDKLDGDPQTLYKCQSGGTGVVSKHCPNGCQINSGADDTCK
jgi:hypothetical protein